jgi:hypothetical protein
LTTTRRCRGYWVALRQNAAGIDFLPWFRSHPERVDTPVLVLTGLYDIPETQAAIIELYGARLLHKPITAAFEFAAHITQLSGVVTGHSAAALP